MLVVRSTEIGEIIPPGARPLGVPGIIAWRFASGKPTQ